MLISYTVTFRAKKEDCVIIILNPIQYKNIVLNINIQYKNIKYGMIFCSMIYSQFYLLNSIALINKAIAKVSKSINLANHKIIRRF